MLFAYGEPIASEKIAQVLEVEDAVVERLLYSLRDAYEQTESGVCLLQLEHRWQIATKKEYGDYIKKILDTRRNVPLSPAALETLTIVAYNQPVSRSFIEQVRGVDSSSSVSNLQEKGLIEEAGRLDLPGRPISFKTTDAFLRTFGLESLADLPPLHEDDPLSEESVVLEEALDGQIMAFTETEAEAAATVKARAEAKQAARAELDATAAQLKAASDAAAGIVKNLKAAEKAEQEAQQEAEPLTDGAAITASASEQENATVSDSPAPEEPTSVGQG